MTERLSDSRVQVMLTTLDRWRTARYRPALTAGVLTLISVLWAGTGQSEAVAASLRPLVERDSLALVICYVGWWLLLRGLGYAADRLRGDTVSSPLPRSSSPDRPQYEDAAGRGTRTEYLSAFAIVTLLTVAIAWPTLLLGLPNAGGHYVRLVDPLFRQPDPPTAFTRPPSWLWDPSVSSALFDPWAYTNYQPHDLLAAQALRVGEWPLWNPYNGLGAPILANGQASPLFPLKLPLYLLLNSGLVPASLAFSYYLLLRLWLAGCGTYLWARAAGLKHQAALLAALIFMFSRAAACAVSHCPLHLQHGPPARLLGLRTLRAPAHLARRDNGRTRARRAIALRPSRAGGIHRRGRAGIYNSARQATGPHPGATGMAPSRARRHHHCVGRSGTSVAHCAALLGIEPTRLSQAPRCNRPGNVERRLQWLAPPDAAPCYLSARWSPQVLPSARWPSCSLPSPSCAFARTRWQRCWWGPWAPVSC